MIKNELLDQLFANFSGRHILVVGDVMIDSYLWGKVDRISPEAPVPVVALNYRENRLGGAANVALNLKALGANPIMCSVIGNDRQGEIFLDLLNKDQLSQAGMLQSSRRITTTKYRVIGNNAQMLRVDEEMLEDLLPEEEKMMLSRIEEIILKKKIEAIILQDYNKGVLTPGIISGVIQIARKNNIFVCVDPKKANFLAYRDVDLFKPNLKEFKEGTKYDFTGFQPDILKSLVTKFQEQQNIRMVMITLSENGVMISKQTDDEGIHFLPAHRRSIADVSGAGDTVISVAALCLASGCTPVQIAALSNLAGGLVCEEVGVIPVNKEKLLSEAITHLSSQFTSNLS